jgi:hypothetical protein
MSIENQLRRGSAERFSNPGSAADIAAMDLFVVPTIGFGRVTSNPSNDVSRHDATAHDGLRTDDREHLQDRRETIDPAG